MAPPSDEWNLDTTGSPRGDCEARFDEGSNSAAPFPSASDDEPSFPANEELAIPLAVARAATGIDFREYKESTICRRMRRRMLLLDIENVADYARVLQENERELRELSRDFLISVTRFFRDPESFDALQQHILPEILMDRPAAEPT
jgi:two-component system CheB/CheR fusion protein